MILGIVWSRDEKNRFCCRSLRWRRICSYRWCCCLESVVVFRENKMVVTQQLIVATQQQLQGLRSLGLVARPGRRGHIAIPISWNGLIVPGRGKGLAMFLTLLGVGSMGALLALRYATGASAPISFPWSEAGARIFQSKQTLSIDSQKQQQQQHQQQEEEQLTVPGLQNVGNNCFLNVVLQVSKKPKLLSWHTPPYQCMSLSSNSKTLMNIFSMGMCRR